MFEHFTFGAQAQTQYHQEEDVQASPTDISFPITLSPPAPTTYFDCQTGPNHPGINDIVSKLSQQSLRPEGNERYTQPSRQQYTPAPLDFEITQEEITFSRANGDCCELQTESAPNTPILPHSRGGMLACRRLQRQLNVQLQSCSSHTRGISMLVEEMIESESQCTLRRATLRPCLSSPPPSRAGYMELTGLVVDTTVNFEGREITPDEDEGFAEVEDELWGVEEEITLRRASTPSGIRKYNQVRWRGSADCVSQGPNAGNSKVRSMPRMRRRKVKRVLE